MSYNQRFPYLKQLFYVVSYSLLRRIKRTNIFLKRITNLFMKG